MYHLLPVCKVYFEARINFAASACLKPFCFIFFMLQRQVSKLNISQRNELNSSKLTLQRGVTGTARMLHALTHSSISRQVREQM